METCVAASCAAMSTSTPNIFLQLIQTLLAAQCTLSNSRDYPADRTNEVIDSNQEFDFIIVGGGTAGSIVASRLSEVTNWNVLLIEAGDDPSYISDVPSLILFLFGTDQDYAYNAEPNEGFCQSMKNKRCRWSKGKVLGGSSVINAMLHVFGNDRDYNDWSKMGNNGWSYEEVLPYFTKSLNCGPEGDNVWRQKYCGTGGPMDIRHYNYSLSGMQDVFLNAVREVGIEILENVNSDRFVGYGKAQGTLDNGRRVNAAKAFLSPVKERRNLYVMKNTRVDRILLDGRKATGVQVTGLKSGKTMDVKAKKEVVLSAGSIASPQLLMLSGIGPKEHLQEIGIHAIADLPVGQNLQDHLVWLGLQLKYVNATAQPPSPTYFMDISYEYLMHNKGELATASGCDLLGFVNVTDYSSKYPDVQFHHFHMPRWQAFKTQTLMNAFAFTEEFFDEITRSIMESDIIFPSPALLQPKSRGYLKLASKNPEEPIKIYPNYFGEKEDMETLLKTVDVMKEFTKTKAFKDVDMKIRHVEISNCQHTQPDSREYWECNLRNMAVTLFHPVGTAKMGPLNDPTAVVDSRLRVHGIEKLRVIDASIMPRIPSGNTNAPTMMIAEKGADLMKQDWTLKTEL